MKYEKYFKLSDYDLSKRAHRFIVARFYFNSKGEQLSLEDVSSATGIPTSTINRFESADDVNFKIDAVVALAQFYGVSLDWLLLGEGAPVTYPNIDIARVTTGLSVDAINNLSYITQSQSAENVKALSLFLSSGKFYRLSLALGEIYHQREQARLRIDDYKSMDDTAPALNAISMAEGMFVSEAVNTAQSLFKDNDIVEELYQMGLNGFKEEQ